MGRPSSKSSGQRYISRRRSEFAGRSRHSASAHEGAQLEIVTIAVHLGQMIDEVRLVPLLRQQQSPTKPEHSMREIDRGASWPLASIQLLTEMLTMSSLYARATGGPTSERAIARHTRFAQKSCTTTRPAHAAISTPPSSENQIAPSENSCGSRPRVICLALQHSLVTALQYEFAMQHGLIRARN